MFVFYLNSSIENITNKPSSLKKIYVCIFGDVISSTCERDW